MKLYRPEAVLHADLQICAHDGMGAPQVEQWLSENIARGLLDFNPEDPTHVVLTTLGCWLRDYGRPN